jgi:hypothetical protein
LDAHKVKLAPEELKIRASAKELWNEYNAGLADGDLAPERQNFLEGIFESLPDYFPLFAQSGTPDPATTSKS